MPDASLPSRVATLNPSWGAALMSLSGAAFASLRDPLPGLTADTVVGLVLLASAALVALALTVANVMRLVRHTDAFLADLGNPAIGGMVASWPAGLQILALAVLQAGVVGALPAGSALLIGMIVFVPGVVGVLITGFAFYSRVIGIENVPHSAVSGTWFVPVVPVVLVPSILSRAVALGLGGDPAVWAFLAVVGWGIGFTLFLLLASIVGSRLLVAPPPAPQQAPGWWAWLAPVGAGGLGLLAATTLATDAGVLGDLRDAVTVVITVLWGFAAWWALLAVRVIARERARLHFHVGWWAFGFPTAAFTSLTAEVARLWHLAGLAAIIPVFWGALVVLIVVLGVLTVRGMRTGTVWER